MHDHLPVDLPLAPGWSFFIGGLGRTLIVVGILAFASSVLAWLFSSRSAHLEKIGKIGFILGCVSLFGAFGSLATLFLTDQFQYKYIYGHSELANPTQYKIAAIWSGQEGSFLLWACAAAAFGLLAVRGSGDYRKWFTVSYSAFLGAICGILAYESPFVMQLFDGKAYIPPNGIGLVPSLQNYWVVIHPPTIFLGFGSLTVLFAYAVSALISKSYNDWVFRVRPWSLISLTLVGLGLCMGGFWAYETLGWGGFWKWDPVENVSFVPWTIVAALVHGTIVQVSRSKWHFTNLLLAGLAFLSFVYGTFLTRAGFLDQVSVHSFAKMDNTAHKVLLTFMLVSVVGFLGLWGARLAKFKAEDEVPSEGVVVSRENAYRLGLIFLLLLGAATGIGMSVPLFQAIAGQTPKVVEEHLYHQVLSWAFVPTMLLMAIAPFMSWRGMPLRSLFNRILNVLSISIGLAGVAMIVMSNRQIGLNYNSADTIAFPWGAVRLVPWMNVLIFLCIFTAVANIWRLIEILRRSPMSAGPFLSHLGVAVAMAGLIVSRGFEKKQTFMVQAGTPAPGMERMTPESFVRLIDGQEPDLVNKNNKFKFEVMNSSGNFIAEPGLYYTVDGGGAINPISTPSIKMNPTHDMYVVLHPLAFDVGEPQLVLPGETKSFKVPIWTQMKEVEYKIKYLEMTRSGEAGQAGTQFGAKLEVEGPDGKVQVHPVMSIGAQGASPTPAVIDDHFAVAMERMDAATKGVSLKMHYTAPVYPITLMYKPLTLLVWVGTGILTFGGFLTAWHRRRIRRSPVGPPDNTTAVATEESERNALEPVTQS